MLGMDKIGASYKYCRKSPCEAKLNFFVQSSSFSSVFCLRSGEVKTLANSSDFLPCSFFQKIGCDFGYFAFSSLITLSSNLSVIRLQKQGSFSWAFLSLRASRNIFCSLKDFCFSRPSSVDSFCHT